MNIRKIFLPTLLLAGSLSFGTGVQAGDSPVEVVQAFNDAVNSRNVEAMADRLAKGGVQLTLRPAHPGMPAEMPLSSDIQGTWRTVGAVLFSTTESYRRSVKVTNSIENGDLATVWADATTTTVQKAGADPMILNFSELYMLVKKNGVWKIAVYADNRQPDTIEVGG